MKVALHSVVQQKLVTLPGKDIVLPEEAQLILGFTPKEATVQQTAYSLLRANYPAASIVLCSTAGEVRNNKVLDDSVTAIAIQFSKTRVRPVCLNILDFKDSFEAGKSLVDELVEDDLAYVMVISDGSIVNGSELIRGINEKINARIPVSGGLAGDGDRFQSTLVALNDNVRPGNIVAIAFYGNSLKVGHGSSGGWDMFGPEKIVTKSASNILYEIQEKNALDLYKTYLGKYADDLPGSALLFPLSVKMPGSETSVVRTIFSINEEEKTMTFAGDIPVNSKVRFMKANFDRIVDAAGQAAVQSLEKIPSKNPRLAIMISCVGRKLILGNRIEEEVETVAESFGSDTLLTGFYSYGEVSPSNSNLTCELHNQTITITTFDEV